MRWITAFESHGSVICLHTWRTQKMLNLFSICSVQLIFYLLCQTLRHHERHSTAVMLSTMRWMWFYQSTTCFWINIHHAHRHLSSTLSVMLRALPSLCLWGIKDFWKAGIRVMEMWSLGKGVDVLGRHPVFPASLTNTL